MELLNLVINLALTFLVYTIPIVAYRFIIAMKPIEKKKAKKITIIYAICAFVVMAVILSALNGSTPGASIFLWSYINYRILTSGATDESKDEQKSTSAEETTEANEEQK